MQAITLVKIFQVSLKIFSEIFEDHVEDIENNKDGKFF